MPDTPPDLINHIGLDLHRAADTWKSLFRGAMVAAGYPVFDEARAALFQHIPYGGIGQGDLVQRIGLSKQAVQQHLVRLQADGLLLREADPDDARRNRIVYSAAGLAMQHTANGVKHRLEADMRARLGPDAFHALHNALTQISQ